MSSDITLEFKGYWLDSDSLPITSGIYCVYECFLDKSFLNLNRLNIQRLLFIGYGLNVKESIQEHNQLNKMRQNKDDFPFICFSYCELNKVELETIYDAMVFHHHPILNRSSKTRTFVDDISIQVHGNIEKLDPFFIVKKS